MTCIKILFVFLCVIMSGHFTFGYDNCYGSDRCPSSRMWCCKVPYDPYLTKRQCCENVCQSSYINYCSDEPPPSSSSSSSTSTVVVVVPTIIGIIIVVVIVIVIVRVCCCVPRRAQVLGGRQQTVTVINQGVTSPPMQHNIYQTGGVGIHPPPTSSAGYANTGFVPGNPGYAYPPVSNMGYQAQVGQMPPIQVQAAPPPPYAQVDPHNKQPAFNPTNY